MKYVLEDDNVYILTEYEGDRFIKECIGHIIRTQLSYANGQVTATVYNYLDGIQTDYTEPIIFEYEGSQISSTPVNGVTSIDFTSSVTGEHIVKTVNPNMRNGEVKIVV